MVATGFVGQVWGELRAKWAQRISENIDLAIGRRFSRFERHYLTYVQHSHRFIDQKGLATLGERTPELDDVFVDVSLASRSPQHVSGAILSEPPPNITERKSIWDFLTTKEAGPVTLAIIGAPGSGKTTLLRHTATRLCKLSRHRRLPILLMLRENSSLITSRPDIDLPTVINSQIKGQLHSAPGGWFEQRLASGRCVVMFDGLDEVARQEHRQSVVDWVDRQIARYPGNDYMITSRPHGYQEYPLERATVLQVRRFTSAQISKFVHGWYLAIERHSTGNSDDFILRKAEEEADNLLSRLGGTPALLDLASNPLLLTMIANVHRYRGALPGTRAELYAEMCVVLLGRRQQAKKLVEPLRIDQKEVVLRELAFTMMKDRIRDLATPRLTGIIESVLPRVSPSLPSNEFLADIRANGLLLEREHGTYCFAHHTFQEYLAAAHIRERGQLDALTATVGDPWWRETTLLFVARGDADPIVEACLSSGKIPALTLAFDCADAASELTPQLRSRLDGLLAEASNRYTSVERRTLAAAVIASRQLRIAIRMENGAQVSAAPISNSLYQLFLNQKRASGSIRDLISTEMYPISDNDPFVDRIVDLHGFVDWLNRLLESDVIYRLPSSAEIQDPAIAHNPAFQDHCFWFASDESPGHLDLWVAPGKSNPYTITHRESREQAHADAVGPIGVITTYYFALSLVQAIAFAHTLALTRTPDSGSREDLAAALNLALSFANQIASELALNLGYSFDHTTPSIRNRSHRRAYEFGTDASRRQDLRSILVLAFALHRLLDGLLDLDPDLGARPNLDLKRARSRDTIFDQVRDRAPGLSRAMEKARMCALDLDLDQVLDSERDLKDDLERALNRNRDLRLPSELDRDLHEVSMSVLNAAYKQSINLDPDMDLSKWMLLAQASLMLGNPRTASKLEWLPWQDRRIFEKNERTVSPYGLKAQSREGLIELTKMNDEGRLGSLGEQLVSSAAFLNELVDAIADHERELSPYLASYMRLTAYAIARKAQQLASDTLLPQKFFDVAAGIIALERNEHTSQHANEVIVLAFS